MASDHTPTSAWSTDAARDGEHDRQTSRQRKRRLVEIGAFHNYKIGDVVFFGDKGGKILVLAHSGEVGHQVDADECSPTGRNIHSAAAGWGPVHSTSRRLITKGATNLGLTLT